MALGGEARRPVASVGGRRDGSAREGVGGGGGDLSYTRRREARHRRRRESPPVVAHTITQGSSSSAPADYQEYSYEYILHTGVSAEWSGATGGPPAEVVVRLHPAAAPSSTDSSSQEDLRNYNLTVRAGGGGGGAASGGGVVVRAEEALIVAFVLLLWVAAIALFFNRWGKIRMLEPYQPKFQQQHRASCPIDAPIAQPVHHRPSLSRGCGSCGDYGFGGSGPTFQQCGTYQPCANMVPYFAPRPRQNSVFVGSTGAMALIPESPQRRSRSAADLPALLEPEPRRPLASPRASTAPTASALHVDRHPASPYLTVTDV